MDHIRIISPEDISALTATRTGEQKLGEVIRPAGVDWRESLRDPTVKFVLLGIPEDIGIRANGGLGGAHTLWEPALKALLNVQHDPLMKGEQILILGHVDSAGWMERSLGASKEALVELVAELDDVVSEIIREIVGAGKIPIVIGGGHNNAYPIIKGCSIGSAQKINTINLDAHTDYRVKEGRHSGNGFRYAKEEGCLNKYAVVGLHRNYNNPSIIEEFNKNSDLHCSFYDDIVNGNSSFEEMIAAGLFHVNDGASGIEIDLDCIENVLSSAMTPSGFNALQARQYISRAAQELNPAYLHLTEGAAELSDGRKDGTTAKLVAYLVTDFLRATAGF